MPLTPESLPRHELNGLRVRVVEAADPGLIGIAGRVVVETTRTLHVEDRVGGESSVRQVPKTGTTFEFQLEDSDAASATDGAVPSEDGEFVTVDGTRLTARPARRSERTGDPKWR